MSQLTTKFDYSGKPVRAWDDETLSLTDMWRASGADEARRPVEWLRSADATKFIAALTEVVNVGNSHLAPLTVTTRGGKDPGTRAHWQIGLAYAKYLSPEFHMWCNTVVRERMEGRVAPTGHKVTLRDVGGVVKAVTHKELMESEARTTDKLMELQLRLTALAEGYDPSRDTSIAFKPMVKILTDAGVPSKGRRSLTQRCSKLLNKMAIREKRQHHVRLSNETGKFLFHVDLAREWLTVEGNAILRAHLDKLSGQSVLRLVAPTKKPGDGQ